MLGSKWRKILFSSLSHFQAELCTPVMLVAHYEENIDPPTFLFIVTLIDFRQPSPGHRIVSVPMMMMRGWHQIGINCILILKYQFEREMLPRPLQLKVYFHWKPHHCWPFDPLAVSQQEHLCVCVCGRKNKQKAFTKFRRPSDSVSQQGGWEGVTCVSTTSESSFVFGFGRKWAKITPPAAQFFSLEVTDTFSLTPCARTPQCWFFAFAQNFLKIRFVLHRNRIFLGRKSSRPISQILSFWSGWRCLYGGERLTGSLGFPRWPEEASTRTHDPTSRGRTLPTMRGLWSSNHIGIWKTTNRIL